MLVGPCPAKKFQHRLRAQEVHDPFSGAVRAQQGPPGSAAWGTKRSRRRPGIALSQGGVRRDPAILVNAWGHHQRAPPGEWPFGAPLAAAVTGCADLVGSALVLAEGLATGADLFWSVEPHIRHETPSKNSRSSRRTRRIDEAGLLAA